jgi:PBP1b-binding outer membrane lipoprotein LpoB
MSSRISMLLSAFLLGLFLVGCSESEAPASNEATTEEANPVVLQNAKIENGMTQEQVKALLGDPKVIQTRTIDELTIVHSEWSDKSGTTSVQFQNGKVTFNQFFPASE